MATQVISDAVIDQTSTGSCTPPRTKKPASAQKQSRREVPAIVVRRGLLGRFNGWVKRRIVEGVLLRRQAERLYLVFGGHIFFQTLHAGVHYGVFTLLKQRPGLTRQQIAEELGIGEQPARIMILGLVSSRLLKQRFGRLYNTILSAELLCEDSATNIIPYVHLQHHVMYPGMRHFCDALRTGKNVGLEEFAGDESTLYERLRHEPCVEKVFHDAMSALSVQTNAILAENLDLSDVDHLIDVGGGDGTNIITLARRHPNLKASVFDFPSVCKIAEEHISESNLADRLSAISGNAFRDPFPRGADCFLFAHFCTIWSEAKNRQLFAKTFDALPSGGRIIVFNMMQSNDECGPLSAAVGSPYFLTIATGEGMLYTWNEYATWLKEAGFKDVKCKVLPRDHGFITGIK
jgi:precorrin-6B methylase 2